MQTALDLTADAVAVDGVRAMHVQRRRRPEATLPTQWMQMSLSYNRIISN